MDRYQVEEGEADELRNLPSQDILGDIAAGLDDLKHSRGEPTAAVLSRMDKMLASWKAGKSAVAELGEDKSDGSASNRESGSLLPQYR